jgi:hypothetical protein
MANGGMRGAFYGRRPAVGRNENDVLAEQNAYMANNGMYQTETGTRDYNETEGTRNVGNFGGTLGGLGHALGNTLGSGVSMIYGAGKSIVNTIGKGIKGLIGLFKKKK